MSVVKFQATIENGNIVIPMQFRNQVTGKVEVIVSTNENGSEFVPLTRDETYDGNGSRDENFIYWLIKNPLEVDGSTPFLTRDEIYDRKL